MAVPDNFVYPDTTADFSVKRDGYTLVTGSAEMGEVTDLEVPVDDVLRLTLVINEGAGPTWYNLAGWGDAQVAKGSC